MTKPPTNIAALLESTQLAESGVCPSGPAWLG